MKIYLHYFLIIRNKWLLILSVSLLSPTCPLVVFFVCLITTGKPVNQSINRLTSAHSPAPHWILPFLQAEIATWTLCPGLALDVLNGCWNKWTNRWIQLFTFFSMVIQFLQRCVVISLSIYFMNSLQSPYTFGAYRLEWTDSPNLKNQCFWVEVFILPLIVISFIIKTHILNFVLLCLWKAEQTNPGSKAIYANSVCPL